MQSRRDFLKLAGLAGAGVMIPWKKMLADTPTAFYDTTQLTKFKDPLLAAIPAAVPDSISPKMAKYTIAMAQGQWKFHSEMPFTKTWGYGGFPYLGPTIETRMNQLIGVNWVNNLPTTHLVENDPMVRMVGMMDGKPEGIASVHVHGAQTQEIYDGGPENWYPSGQSFQSWYPNTHDARMMWYHDHAMSSTRINAYVGLAGLWIVRDDYEDSLNLPKGKYEIPLILQDKQFDVNGQLFYLNPWVAEFFGDTILVNGGAWPKLEVEPRKYRFRFLNGAQARFFSLYFDNNMPIYQIGTEAGFLPKTVTFNGQNPMVIANGERFDCIVDFTGYNGQEIILKNNAPVPFFGGDPVTEHTGVVMKFIVNQPLQKKDTSSLPKNPKAIIYLNKKKVTATRFITLAEFEDPMFPDGMPMHINGRPFMGSTITETPHLGDTEIWNFINLSPDVHPMHMHLINYQVLDKIPFNVDAYKQQFGHLQPPDGFDLSVFYTGAPIPPAPNEMGWKETVQAPVGMITRIIVKFDGFTGKYVYHCHILDHEENDMMQYFKVLPALRKDVAGLASVPASFTLHQNYPNPFNPSTTIQFELPKAGNVEIKIYDNVGQEVKTLVNDLYEAGSHKIVWDGNTVFGHHAPSGVYLYTMKTDGFTETKKMVMLK